MKEYNQIRFAWGCDFLIWNDYNRQSFLYGSSCKAVNCWASILRRVIFAASEGSPGESVFWDSTKRSGINLFIFQNACKRVTASLQEWGGLGRQTRRLCGSEGSSLQRLLYCLYCMSVLLPAKPAHRNEHEQSRCLIKDTLCLSLLLLGSCSTVGRLLPACVGRTTLYHLWVWIDSSLWSGLVYVCHIASQHMFDSDQIFVVCVEPPTRSGEGQLHPINTHQF